MFRTVSEGQLTNTYLPFGHQTNFGRTFSETGAPSTEGTYLSESDVNTEV